jgi:hypothetical protein
MCFAALAESVIAMVVFPSIRLAEIHAGTVLEVPGRRSAT